MKTANGSTELSLFEEVQNILMELHSKAASNGRFTLIDCHGFIPWWVSSEVLSAISAIVRSWGYIGLDQSLK